MKQLWDPIVKTADDIQKTASRLIDGGVDFFRAKLGSISLFSASTAIVAENDRERDETHYFLVPNRAEPSGYCLYSVRVLPEGIGPENKLPKAKIFQLPAEGTADHLAELLLQEIKDDKITTMGDDSPLAERLELIAGEIDKQCNLVSGGLLLVGGVVAIANPLLGVGILTKGLLPGIGSTLSSHGIKHASNWLRSRAKASTDTDAEKQARSEMKQIKPEVRVNPTLSLLEQTLSTDDGSFDPVIESSGIFSSVDEAQDLKLGAQAIIAVYDENDANTPALKSWLENLRAW